MKTPTYEDTTLTITASTTNSTALGSSLPKPTTPAVVTRTIYRTSASSTNVPPKQPTATTTGLLPTGAIAGITIASVVGLVSVVLCVLCALGVRIRRCSMSPIPGLARPTPSSAGGRHQLHGVQEPGPVRRDTCYHYTPGLEGGLHGEDRSRSGGDDADRIAAFPGLAREGEGEMARRSRSLVELEGDLVFRERADKHCGNGAGDRDLSAGDW